MAVVTSGPAQVWISTTGTTNNAAWANWNQHWTSIGTTTGSTTWITWNTNYISTNYGVPETDELRAAREERERAETAHWERRRQEQEEVKQRAEELLLALLSDEQAETWREHKWFEVRGSCSGRRYRIRHGITHNVNLMAGSGDDVEVNYCAHPPGVPAEDVCLAQMLLLATNEDEFLRVANARVLRPVLEHRERELRAVA